MKLVFIASGKLVMDYFDTGFENYDAQFWSHILFCALSQMENSILLWLRSFCCWGGAAA
jgi:hypothetical protein